LGKRVLAGFVPHVLTLSHLIRKSWSLQLTPQADLL
jgi:hypothetical protein